MSGASNSTYRVEETSSGRITATLPLPLSVKPTSFFMNKSWG